MWFAILLSVGAVAIGLFFGLRQGKVNNQLLDEGRIVKRKYVITEQAEEFTCGVQILPVFCRVSRMLI